MRDLIYEVTWTDKQSAVVLLRPGGPRLTVAPKRRTAAKFTYDQRLVINGRPGLTIRVFRTTVIPSEIFVQPQHIEKLTQRVAKNVSIRSVVFHPVHRRSDQACRIQAARVFRQSSQEGKPVRFNGSLVRERPQNYRGAIVIAGNHLPQLRFGARKRSRTFPPNIPVDGDFRPHQQAHAVCEADLILIVRVVSQTDEVATKFLRPSEQRLRVTHGVRAPTGDRRLLMQRNATQEDRFSVQQNLRASRLDGSKPNRVVNRIVTRGDLYVIQLRILRGPQLQPGGNMKSRATIGVRNGRSLDPSFGNFYFYRRVLLRRAISVQLNPAVDLVLRSFGQLTPVIADESLRRFDQDYIARDTAAIPPVRVK